MHYQIWRGALNWRAKLCHCDCARISKPRNRRRRTMLDPIIGHRQFVDGSLRLIFEQLDGRQYAFDDDGQRVYGTWILSVDRIDLPVIVQQAGL
jgi:hypothetical protein